jgi:hypothetical protein
VKVVDYCDPFFAGKLTHAKSLVTCVESVLPSCLYNLQ